MKSDAELKQIAIDLHAGRIFSDRHLKDPADMRFVFMPIVFMTDKHRQEMIDDNIDFIYEYMEEAGPRSVNGMPTFMSYRMLNRAESKIMFKHYEELKETLKKPEEELKFVLEVHLVPEKSFGANLRTKMGSSWSKLSRNIRDRHQRTCDICGWKEDAQRKKYTHLHEVWHYDDENHVQTLAEFECVCPTCHAVHHWGYSQLRGMNMKKLTEHACRINGCTREEWKTHVDESRKKWQERSTHEWTVDLGTYSKYC